MMSTWHVDSSPRVLHMSRWHVNSSSRVLYMQDLVIHTRTHTLQFFMQLQEAIVFSAKMQQH
jgi:hypothetical protein